MLSDYYIFNYDLKKNLTMYRGLCKRSELDGKCTKYFFNVDKL